MWAIISGNNEHSVSYLFFFTAQKKVILHIPSFSRTYKPESDEIKRTQKVSKEVQGKDGLR